MPRGVYPRKKAARSQPASPALSGDILTGEERRALVAGNGYDIDPEPAEPNDIAAIALVGAFTHWFDRADAATKRRILKSLIDSAMGVTGT